MGEFAEKSANETKVNETVLENALETLKVDDDEPLDIEYIEKTFNNTNTSLNDTEEVEFEEYDVEEEKDEITAPDNQDNVEQYDEQDDEQDQEEEALVEVSANETQVDVNMTDVNMTDVNMTAVNKTELEETLKELEEQGEELDFDC